MKESEKPGVPERVAIPLRSGVGLPVPYVSVRGGNGEVGVCLMFGLYNP